MKVKLKFFLLSSSLFWHCHHFSVCSFRAWAGVTEVNRRFSILIVGERSRPLPGLVTSLPHSAVSSLFLLLVSRSLLNTFYSFPALSTETISCTGTFLGGLWSQVLAAVTSAFLALLVIVVSRRWEGTSGGHLVPACWKQGQHTPSCWGPSPARCSTSPRPPGHPCHFSLLHGPALSRAQRRLLSGMMVPPGVPVPALCCTDVVERSHVFALGSWAFHPQICVCGHANWFPLGLEASLHPLYSVLVCP